MTNRKMNVGWAQTSITPNGSVLMEGQMYQRYSRYVHDPIMATALVLITEIHKQHLFLLDMTESSKSCNGFTRKKKLKTILK